MIRIRGDLKDTKRRIWFKEGIVTLKSNMVQAEGSLLGREWYGVSQILQ